MEVPPTPKTPTKTKRVKKEKKPLPFVVRSGRGRRRIFKDKLTIVQTNVELKWD